MNKLKQAVGRRLVNIGYRLIGSRGSDLGFTELKYQGKPIVRDTEVRSAVVEARDVRQDWTPTQSGNVVIAEPDVMREWRRKNDQM